MIRGSGTGLLADKARDVGEALSDRTVWRMARCGGWHGVADGTMWRIASSNSWWSGFGKKQGPQWQEARAHRSRMICAR